jgi:hypothetical protein
MQIGVAWALTLIFIVLKLTGYIDWAWVFVFAPLWIGVVFILCLLFLVASFGSIRKRDRGTD